MELIGMWSSFQLVAFAATTTLLFYWSGGGGVLANVYVGFIDWTDKPVPTHLIQTSSLAIPIKAPTSNDKNNDNNESVTASSSSKRSHRRNSSIPNVRTHRKTSSRSSSLSIMDVGEIVATFSNAPPKKSLSGESIYVISKEKHTFFTFNVIFERGAA